MDQHVELACELKAKVPASETKVAAACVRLIDHFDTLRTLANRLYI